MRPKNSPPGKKTQKDYFTAWEKQAAWGDFDAQ